MRKNLLVGLFCLMLLCVAQPKANAMAFFYTDATYPITATGAKVQDLTNLRRGQSSATSVLFLVETGDASIDTAARNGGITKISTVDVKTKVGIFTTKVTTVVTGE